MKIGVQLHPQATTTAAMQAAWQQADSMGVDSLWVWDHFYPLYGDPAATHFECYSLLAAMAVTPRVPRSAPSSPVTAIATPNSWPI